MAMSVGPSEGGEDTPMSDINTTPLVDVMLVLLIIFLITVPVVIQTVPVELPQVVFEPTTTKPENVSLSVKGDGAGGCEIYWNLTKVNSDELLERAVKKLEDEIARQGGAENVTDETMPEAHIRGDINTPYKCIGGAVFTMQRAGFSRVGFISEPAPGQATAVTTRS
jgi:biopolymer transport protein ExbD